MSQPGPASRGGARLKVVVDTSPLYDGRRQAGIGRYVSAMVGALGERSDVAIRSVAPFMRPPHDSWVTRWANAQPALAVARLAGRGTLLHGMASEASAAWSASRQVVTIHDVIPWTLAGASGITRVHLATQARRLRRCAAVIAVSDRVADEAIDRLGLYPTRVHIVPEGVSPTFTTTPGGDDEKARARAGIPPGDYALWVGSLRRHDPRKALDVLLEAARQQPSTTWVLVGAEGEESARLRQRADDLGIRLVLPGFVSDPDLAAIYRGATVCLLPSIHEGFGLPVLEAMASGVPVVTAPGGNLADLAGDAAVLVPANDATALAGSVSRLMHDRDERARLGAAGPVVAARYTWQRTAEMTVAVYRSLGPAAATGGE